MLERSIPSRNVPQLKPLSQSAESALPPEGRHEFHLGSWISSEDRKRAIDSMLQGEIFGGNWGGVVGLWGNADSEKAIERMLEAKRNPNAAKVFSTLMPTDAFLDLVDMDALPQDMQELLSDRKRLRQRVGSLCHLRAPIDIRKAPIDKKTGRPVVIPETVLSHDDEGRVFLQNLDPFGHGPFSRFVAEARAAGMPFIGVTSMNDSAQNEPEITDLFAAAAFCRERGIDLLMRDPHYNLPAMKGSFAILDVLNKRVVRDGQIPVDVIEKSLGQAFDRTGMKPAKFPQEAFPVFEDLSPELQRAAVVRRIRTGESEEEIRERLDKTVEAMKKRKNGSTIYSRTK